MKNHGGFEHNRQSLRLVEELEQKYPDFPGLNLTWEVREGLIKHCTSYDHPDRRKGFEAKNSSLEAQVANLADEITYYSHDLDDGLDSGLLSEKKLRRDVRIWAGAARQVQRQHGDLADECRRYFTIRTIIDLQVRDVVENSERLIRDAGVQSADEVRLCRKALVQYSQPRRELNLELRDYLYKNLYYNPVVYEPNSRALRMLEELFPYYLKHPDQIGGQSRKRVRRAGLHRAVCDYLAGMTDRYVMLEYQRLFGAKTGSAATGRRPGRRQSPARPTTVPNAPVLRPRARPGRRRIAAV
jgi:dGTPase